MRYGKREIIVNSIVQDIFDGYIYSKSGNNIIMKKNNSEHHYLFNSQKDSEETYKRSEELIKKLKCQ